MRSKQSKFISPSKSAADKPNRHVRQKITINLDSDIIDFFKLRADEEGTAYQFLINQTLRDYVRGNRVDQLAIEVRERLLLDQSFLQRILESASETQK